MSNITFNQNYMFPAIYHGQLPQQQSQPISEGFTDHMFNNQSQYPTEFCSYQPVHFQGFQPFNITITNNNNHYQLQQPTVTSGSISTDAPSVQNVDTLQNDLTSVVMSTLHQATDTRRENSTVKRMDNDASRQSQRYQQTDRSPLSELRLPCIKTTSNMAANVMSEESDLGYCSFSDMSNIQEVSDTFDYSDVSDDTFDDVKSSFSDIIDDVLDSIEDKSVTFTTFEPVKSNFDTKIDVDRSKTESNSSFDNHIKHETIETKENFYGQTNFQNAPIYNGYTQCYVPAGMQSYHEVIQSERDVCYQPLGAFLQERSSTKLEKSQHRGLRPHHCPYCEKSFTQKSTLRTHIRTHTGERPYTCQFCARAFGDYSTYRKHVRVHTGEKPYVCDVCQKSFTQSGNMIRHRDVHFKKSEGHKKDR